MSEWRHVAETEDGCGQCAALGGLLCDTPTPDPKCSGCGASWNPASHEPPKVACCPDCSHFRCRCGHAIERA